MKQRTQTYNDGVAVIYDVGKVAAPGNMPKEGLTFKVGPLGYDERTVGMSRFWAASQASVKISRLIRLPRLKSVSTQDILILDDGQQYGIKQLQYPDGVTPDSMDLSLERLEVAYAVD